MTNLKNKNPIFIVGFARGGSAIMLNILRSHPRVCSPCGETQEVFLGKGRRATFDTFFRRLDYLPIVLSERRNIFSTSDWSTRKLVSDSSSRRIDSILFKDRFRREENLKGPSEDYTVEEIGESRLLCKNLNGLIYATRFINEIYPDATFIGLVRDPRAICEGHIRRNSYAVEEIANHCSKAMDVMIKDANELPNFYLFKYEDIIDNPEKALENIYAVCNLDLSDLEWVRMVTKNVVGHNLAPKGQKLKWYKKNNFWQHFVTDANKNQIERLTDFERELIEDVCRTEMTLLNYQ